MYRRSLTEWANFGNVEEGRDESGCARCPLRSRSFDSGYSGIQSSSCNDRSVRWRAHATSQNLASVDTHAEAAAPEKEKGPVEEDMHKDRGPHNQELGDINGGLHDLPSSRSGAKVLANEATGIADEQATNIDLVFRSTTVMLFNIARYSSQLDLAADLDEAGLGGRHDLIYIPACRSTTKMPNVRHAYVNFKSLGDVHECYRLVNNQTLGRSTAHRRVQVKPAAGMARTSFRRHEGF